MSGKLCNPGSSQPIDLDRHDQQISLLEEQWLSFKDHVIPLSADAIQLQEMKRAFFAGAQGVQYVLNDAIARKLPDEEVAKVFPAIELECMQFGNRELRKASGPAN